MYRIFSFCCSLMYDFMNFDYEKLFDIYKIHTLKLFHILLISSYYFLNLIDKFYTFYILIFFSLSYNSFLFHVSWYICRINHLSFFNCFQLSWKAVFGDASNKWFDKSLNFVCYKNGMFISNCDVSIALIFFIMLMNIKGKNCNTDSF